MKTSKYLWLFLAALGIVLPGCATHHRNTANSYSRERVVGEVQGEGARKIPVTEVRP